MKYKVKYVDFYNCITETIKESESDLTAAKEVILDKYKEEYGTDSKLEYDDFINWLNQFHSLNHLVFELELQGENLSVDFMYDIM